MSVNQLEQLKLLLGLFHDLWDERIAEQMKRASSINLVAKMEEYGANQKQQVKDVKSMVDSAIKTTKL